MYKVTKYPHGTFSWADNSSTDAETAKAFYMELFGWGKNEIPISEDMTYTMFQHQGENVAALSGMMPQMQEMGIPSHWTNYVTVDDVDALDRCRHCEWRVDCVRTDGCLRQRAHAANSGSDRRADRLLAAA